MPWTPTFKIYATNGSTLIYTLPLVIQSNHNNVGNNKFIRLENGRSIGATYIEGGLDDEDIVIEGVLRGTSYENLVTLRDSMLAAIVSNTAYYLKVDKSPSATYEFKVKRLQGIEFTIGDKNKMNTRLDYKIVLKNNSW